VAVLISGSMNKIEPAPSGRAACRGCKQTIAKGVLRFAEEFQNPYSEEGGASFRYWHLPCAAVKLANELEEALAQYRDPIEDRGSLEALVREHRRPEMPYAERAGSGRAHCRACDVAIKKGELRVAFERTFEGPMGPQKAAAYVHPKCVARYLEREVEHGREALDRQEIARRVLANSKLSKEDIDAVRNEMEAIASPG
jgi:PHP family Zn ribbon phosphoesterase